MKIAEALILRASHQGRMDELESRLMRSAKVQEGDKPAENQGSADRAGAGLR